MFAGPGGNFVQEALRQREIEIHRQVAEILRESGLEELITED